MFLEPFLNKGMMFASFHSRSRTIPSCSEMFNTCSSGILICSTVYFSMLCAIPSTPGDLLYFIKNICYFASYYFRRCSLLPSLSSAVPVNFVSGTGNELVSSLVNTELKCIFNSSAIKNPYVFIFPALSSSGPTLSRTFNVLQ